MGHRSNIKHTPTIQKNPAEQQIVGEYSKTVDGKRFLLYYGVKGDPPNNGEADKRLVIALFSTKESFETCIKSKHVCFDGTFKVCPRPYYQLYTIQAYVGDLCLPLIYVFFTNTAFHIITYIYIVLTIAEIKRHLQILDINYSTNGLALKLTT